MVCIKPEARLSANSPPEPKHHKYTCVHCFSADLRALSICFRKHWQHQQYPHTGKRGGTEMQITLFKVTQSSKAAGCSQPLSPPPGGNTPGIHQAQPISQMPCQL